MQELIEKMKALDKYIESDPERAHSEADYLMCDAVKLLGGDSDEARQLVDLFRRIPKW